MAQKVVLSFKVKKEFREALAKLADAEHRSVSNYIRLILREHLEKKGYTFDEPEK